MLFMNRSPTLYTSLRRPNRRLDIGLDNHTSTGHSLTGQIPGILSTLRLQDLSVLDDKTALHRLLWILRHHVRLSPAKEVQVLAATSDTTPESIREIVLHAILIPMEPSLIQISRNRLLLSWIKECKETLEMLVYVFETIPSLKSGRPPHPLRRTLVDIQQHRQMEEQWSGVFGQGEDVVADPGTRRTCNDASSSQLVSEVMEGDEKEEEAGYPSTDNQQNEASLGSPEDTLLTKPANEHENGEADGVGSERVVGDATPLGFHSERLITVSRAFYSIRTFSHPSVSAGSQQGRSVGSSSPSFVVHLAHILIQSQSEFSRIREAFARMGEWGKMQGMVVDEEIAKQESEGLPVVKRVNLYAEMLKDPSFGESSEEERQELMLEKKKEYDELLRKMWEKREKEQEEQEGEEEDEMQLSESESSDWESESESESWESSSEEGFEEVVVFREISEMQQREEGRLNEKKRLELERMMGGQKEGEDGQFVICGQRVQFSGEGKESGAEEQSEEDEDGDLSSSSSSGKESEGQSESEKEEWSSDSHSKSDSSHHSDDDADEVSEGSTESTERMHSDSEDDDTSASFEKDELEPV
ncbi:hypothetical protein BLNAU_15636 [Blattamonas nauphoetae]|uniref:Uncharacterized protein n=1 Tax=Blattamonas nauphoetae TaxID=2049346 RepID=A0ABQ9XDZ0_9EUKA|nr:hypothetical protein BLNAU_15636 [Blattamonas nauphoetae]